MRFTESMARLIRKRIKFAVCRRKFRIDTKRIGIQKIKCNPIQASSDNSEEVQALASKNLQV